MKTTRRQFETVYIDPDRLKLLKELAAKTRILRSVLWREALEDLLVKYGLLKPEASYLNQAEADGVSRTAGVLTTAKPDLEDDHG
jgi:predicted transcriptional regulator